MTSNPDPKPLPDILVLAAWKKYALALERQGVAYGTIVRLRKQFGLPEKGGE